MNTVVGPGADAALLRLAGPGLPPSSRGVALTTDSNPRACALDPRAGTALVLAEGVANLACVGATPVAVVNCLNFGNPEHPEVMWQLSECIDGMAEACRALSLPVIGGNVSFYNESGGADIDPTPVLGVLGLVDAVHARPPGLGWSEGDTVVLLGAARRARLAAASAGCLPARGHALGHRAARPPRRRRPSPCRGLRRPRVALRVRGRAGRRAGGRARRSRAGRRAGRRRLVHAVHDVSGGGLAVALAEMAAEAGVGCALDLDDPAELFSELPSRIVVATADPDALCCPRRRRPASPPRSSAAPAATACAWAAWSTSRSQRCARPTRATWRRPWATRDDSGLCDNEGRVMGVKEACGVFGVYAPGSRVANLTFDGLFALQHRGQESAGMAVSDGNTVTVVKDMGLVATVFDERTLSGLDGHLAIGHTRYSTHGSSDWAGAQPVYRPVGRAGFALGHNGNLTNTADLAEKVGMLPGSVATDSDVVAELLAHAFPETEDLATAHPGWCSPSSRVPSPSSS